MGIVEKANAYCEALSRAREEYLSGGQSVKEVIERIFPVIKEIEDERIRETLISFVKCTESEGTTLINGVPTSSMLNWLEKQVEQEKPQVYKTEDGVVIEYSESEGYKFVKPKYKVGDWVVGGGFRFLICDIRNNTYETFSGEHRIFGIDALDKAVRLWTIDDAKDGDVLCTYECGEPKIVFILKGTPKAPYVLSYYCFYNIMYSGFDDGSVKGFLAPNYPDVKPATKEQCELLFQKMKEAGYEWDSKSKKPIKI